MSRLQDVEQRHVLRGRPLQIPPTLLLVVSPDTEQAGVRLLHDVLGTVPEDELLIEAVPRVVLPGSLLQAVGEHLGVVPLTVGVAAAKDVAGGHGEVTAAVVLVLVGSLTSLSAGSHRTCNSSSGGCGCRTGGGSCGSGGACCPGDRGVGHLLLLLCGQGQGDQFWWCGGRHWVCRSLRLI